jgi:hypothetical protein
MYGFIFFLLMNGLWERGFGTVNWGTTCFPDPCPLARPPCFTGWSLFFQDLHVIGAESFLCNQL